MAKRSGSGMALKRSQICKIIKMRSELYVKPNEELLLLISRFAINP